MVVAGDITVGTSCASQPLQDKSNNCIEGGERSREVPDLVRVEPHVCSGLVSDFALGTQFLMLLVIADVTNFIENSISDPTSPRGLPGRMR